MGIHLKKHGIIDTDNHAAGTVASVGEYNVVATNDAGNIAEVVAEAPNLTSFVLNRIVVRGTNGQLFVPAAPTADQHAASKIYVDTVIASGPWKAKVHSVVPVHNAATVGDGSGGGAALVAGDHVINTTDGKTYTVTAGTGNGSQVTWDAGVLYTSVAIAPADYPDAMWQFDPQTQVWSTLNSSTHPRLHSMTSVTDHSATAWRVFFSNTTGAITELALGGTHKVLLSGGASTNPLFSSVGLYPTKITAAGELPVTSDLAGVADDTEVIVIGSTGRRFKCFKDSSGCYGIEYGLFAV